LTLLGTLDAHPECSECIHGGDGICAFEKTAYLGFAFSDRSQHDRAMRNRLIAGHAYGASQGVAAACGK
jgi:hypothetical protein